MLCMIFINMNLKKIIKEEINDFDWAEGPINFTIDDIVGKQMYYRENNVAELEAGHDESNPMRLSDIPRDEIILNKIIWDKAYKLKSYDGNKGTIVIRPSKGNSTNLNKRLTVDFSVNDIVTYVNLGIWALEDEKGNIINDFSGKYITESTDFDWAKDIEPEITAESIPLFYNKPFYWYNNGKPLSDWGMPRIYWISESHINQRGKEISLICYKDMGWTKPKVECVEMYDETITNLIRKGTLVFQPQLSDINGD